MLFALYIGVRLANFQFTMGPKIHQRWSKIQVQFSLYSSAPVGKIFGKTQLRVVPNTTVEWLHSSSDVVIGS
jgi:hypothetical protein